MSEAQDVTGVIELLVSGSCSPRSFSVMVHLLGFAGSAFFILAVTMRSVVWLRSFALAGSLAFVAYGVVLAVWPVVLTNVVTAAIHLIQLRALARIGTPLPTRASVFQRNRRANESVVLAQQPSAAASS